jgi:DNA repair protein RadC
MFDSNGRYIATEFMGDGTVNAAGFMPRKLLDAACRRGASALLLAHNHPCGSPIPSKDDYVTTDQMRTVVKNSGIEFIEHYVVSGFEIYGILSDFNNPTPTPDASDVLRVGIDPIL